VGFSPSSDLLLVTSSQGRGVFDCRSGERLARDGDESGDFEDPVQLEANGIGPVSGTVRMSGLYGGGLPNSTADGWSAERLSLDWPVETLLLFAPGSTLHWQVDGKPPVFTKVYLGSEIRAWGFSPTGRSLVVATSSDLTAYGRS